MTGSSGRVYRFGEFELQPDEHRLLLSDVEVPVRPKPFETLLYLVERHGHLVEKGELLARLWQDTFVSEGALTRCIKEVRQALGDDAHEPRFIQTKNRVGYTFIADVEEDGADEPPPLPRPPPAVARPRRVALDWPIVAVLALLVILGGGYLLWRGLDSGPSRDHRISYGGAARPDRQMIVVLPFDNLGPAAEAFFADGMTEELMARLAAVRGLGVISRTTAFQYRDSGRTVPEIGRELGVDYVLEGSVLWDKSSGGVGKVRITPQLIRVADDTHLWAHSYERDADRVFEVQSEIANEVARHLGIALLGPRQAASSVARMPDLDAYRAYLLGRHYAGQPHFTAENWQRVLDYYQRAVEIDAGFTAAWADLSRAHSRFYHLNADRSPGRRQLAWQALERALDLEPEAAEVRLALGYFLLWIEDDRQQAEKELQIAARGRPDDAEVLSAIGTLQRAEGRWPEAQRTFERALELSPLDPAISLELAYVLWPTRQYDRAVAACERSGALLPDPSWRAWPNLTKAFVYWSWGIGLERAREALEAVPADHAWVPWSWYWQAIFEGDYGAALDRLAAVPEGWIRIKIASRPTALLAALAHEAAGETRLAAARYRQAERELRAALREAPGDARLRSSLGIALAGLGKADAAVREGRAAVDLLPLNRDAFYGVPPALDLAHIYTLVGDEQAALDQLELLLGVPSWLSAPWLRRDPRWNQLRDEPRFRRLVASASS